MRVAKKPPCRQVRAQRVSVRNDARLVDDLQFSADTSEAYCQQSPSPSTCRSSVQLLGLTRSRIQFSAHVMVFWEFCDVFLSVVA